MKQATLILLVAAATMLPGCRKELPRADAPRPRIVTYSPALTTIVFAMGLGEHVVGVTAFCELPAGQERPVVGDCQNVSTEKFVRVRPDVVLIQQDPATLGAVRRLLPDARIEYFSLEKIENVAEAMERIGHLAGWPELGRRHRRAFEDKLAAVRKSVAGLPRPKVYFLTGANPPAVAGRESFLHELIELAGGEDLSGQFARWSRISVEHILRDRPDVIVCQAYEDADRAREYLATLRGVPAVENGRVFVVTDRRWTIPSACLADLAGQLAGMLHPELREGGAAK